MSVPLFQVNEPELRDNTRNAMAVVLERHTLGMGPAQHYLAQRIASGTMADWTWKSDVSPNQERRYLEPRTSQEVAELIAKAAADFARNKPGLESDMNQLAIAPQAHAARAATLNEVKHMLARRARGQ